MCDPFDPIDPGTLAAGREARGISRSELARLAGTNVSQIHKIEHGKIDPKVKATWAGIVGAMLSSPLTERVA